MIRLIQKVIWFFCRKKKIDEAINKNNKILSQLKDDYDAGYEKGLLDGYTKSIVLIRNLQRSDRRSLEIAVVRIMLEQAMELISEKIEANNNE